jgi:hypothetical protein
MATKQGLDEIKKLCIQNNIRQILYIIRKKNIKITQILTIIFTYGSPLLCYMAQAYLPESYNKYEDHAIYEGVCARKNNIERMLHYLTLSHDQHYGALEAYKTCNLQYIKIINATTQPSNYNKYAGYVFYLYKYKHFHINIHLTQDMIDGIAQRALNANNIMVRYFILSKFPIILTDTQIYSYLSLYTQDISMIALLIDCGFINHKHHKRIDKPKAEQLRKKGYIIYKK